MRLAKCKKEWDEKLYKFALKRFNRISNIGFYKMFLTPRDFIHDVYLTFINNKTLFDESDSFQDYCDKFVKKVFVYKKQTYHYDKANRAAKGKEYLQRKSNFIDDPNWDIVSLSYNYSPDSFDSSIVNHIGQYEILPLYAQGYTYKEIAESLNTYPVKVRKVALQEIEHFKKTDIFTEITEL